MSKKEKNNKEKKIKFDPPLKNRYFPGEINDGLAKLDFKSYKLHRMRLVNMKPVVDDKPPRFVVDVYYDQKKLNSDARMAKMNCKINFDITKKLNAVFRLGGKTDCWNYPYAKYKADRHDVFFWKKRLEKDNQKLYKHLTSKSSNLSPEVMAKEWKKMKRAIEEKSRFPWFKEVSKYPSITENCVAPTNSKGLKRSKCFFDLEFQQSKLPIGRVVFQLYNDFAPLTCANFEAFCKGYNGLSYKKTPFHRIVLGHCCQGGDVEKFNGAGGASIYEDVLPEDEKPILKHTCEGVLSTCCDDFTKCDSKFNITFRPLTTMNGKRIVFGKVIKGMQNLFKLEAYGTKFGKPLQSIIVSNCGVLSKPVEKSPRQSTRRRSTSSRVSHQSKN